MNSGYPSRTLCFRSAVTLIGLDSHKCYKITVWMVRTTLLRTLVSEALKKLQQPLSANVTSSGRPDSTGNAGASYVLARNKTQI